MDVQVIATLKKETERATTEERPLRVAAYCRVSTDMEEQEGSYEVQCSHYTEYIRQHEGWELAGIYADKGASGTSTRRRDQFQRLMEDCQEGRVDLVMTKSISRFARNTLDCLKYIRLLKDMGIAVYFEKESVNTLDAKGEVLITIMASIAQQESQSISQNVKMGIRYRMQQGKGRPNTTRLLGLKRGSEPGSIEIVPEEAALVRRIFRMYLEGDSPGRICRRLEMQRILSPGGGAVWYPSTIASMLANEKYAGDMLMQKYYTVDFLSHRVVRNRGQLPQYYVEDHHPPIVPGEVFRQVQEEMVRRASFRREPGRVRCGSEEAFFGRLVCGICDRTLKRYRKANGSEADWRCRKRAYLKKTETREVPGECKCRIVSESEAKQAVLEAMNHLPGCRPELEERFRRLQEQVPEGTEPEQVLARAEIRNQAMQVRMLLEWIDQVEGRREELPDRPECTSYEAFFRRTRWKAPKGVLDPEGRVQVFRDEVTTRFLDRIIVQDSGFDVSFKAGVTVRIGVPVGDQP